MWTSSYSVTIELVPEGAGGGWGVNVAGLIDVALNVTHSRISCEIKITYMCIFLSFRVFENYGVHKQVSNTRICHGFAVIWLTVGVQARVSWAQTNSLIVLFGSTQTPQNYDCKKILVMQKYKCICAMSVTVSEIITARQCHCTKSYRIDNSWKKAISHLYMDRWSSYLLSPCVKNYRDFSKAG